MLQDGFRLFYDWISAKDVFRLSFVPFEYRVTKTKKKNIIFCCVAKNLFSSKSLQKKKRHWFTNLELGFAMYESLV